MDTKMEMASSCLSRRPLDSNFLANFDFISFFNFNFVEVGIK